VTGRWGHAWQEPNQDHDLFLYSFDLDMIAHDSMNDQTNGAPPYELHVAETGVLFGRTGNPNERHGLAKYFPEDFT